MLLMPLTPRLLLLSFDPAIYRLEKRLGELGVIDRASDVAAFNDLQAVRGHANLYFRDWNDRALVASIYEKAKALPHVGVTSGQPHPNASRDRNHPWRARTRRTRARALSST
jgi:hypothetical protein